ncbi:MAG: 50S ribosomal protein L23 [Candidatus Paceibacterota bacterium]|jgi:large subunit ribosomal protein L23
MNTNIIKNPRVTEKGSYSLEHNVYTFDITKEATKAEIKKAIFALYKVHPVKVNVLAIPKKNVMLRGKPGSKGGGRKAFVYLKDGDKIEFV